MDKDTKLGQEAYDVDRFPGAATDVADSENSSEKEVKQDVRELNNNPRNNGDPV